MKTNILIKGLFALFLPAFLLLNGCKDNTTTPTPGPTTYTYYGSTDTMGMGTVQSWVKADNSGNPTSIGINFNDSALVSLPSNASETSFVLNLPTQSNNAPFNHISVDWDPHGHDPVAIYGLPHFDIHFYMISMQERQLITGVGADTVNMYQQPAAGYLATDYFLFPGSGEPTMGAHAIDTTDAELHGQTFTEALVYSYYKGQIVSFESMITLAYLQTNSTQSFAIKQPAKFAKTGYYPTRMLVSYDPASHMHTVALTDMVFRAGQ